MDSTMKLRLATAADAPAIAAIYNPYIAETVITFELDHVSDAQMAARIQSKLQHHYTWLVAEQNGVVQGYAYCGQFRERAAYQHVVESSIYLAPEARGQGLGRQLYIALLDQAQALGYREMMGVITVPNVASVALHQQLGFVCAGHIARAGFKFGRYVDVEFWQKSLI